MIFSLHACLLLRFTLCAHLLLVPAVLACAVLTTNVSPYGSVIVVYEFACFFGLIAVIHGLPCMHDFCFFFLCVGLIVYVLLLLLN